MFFPKTLGCGFRFIRVSILGLAFRMSLGPVSMWPVKKIPQGLMQTPECKV